MQRRLTIIRRHTVRIVDGFGPGSTPDLVSRLFGQWFSEHLGQPFIVENRTGAGGNVAAETVLAAPADGYTLLGCVTAHAINASVYQKLDYNFLRDFAPVGGILRFPMVLLVNPAFPATTFPEFIAYAKANPGQGERRLARRRNADACRDRNAQHDGRNRPRSRALSRRRAAA